METAFADTEFMTAEDKAKTLKAWTTFLKHGCQPKHFTRRIYDHLIQHCSFIAHYDRGGFYAVYFEDPEATKRFLGQFDPEGDHVSVEYGMTYWYADERYADINKAMSEAAGKYIRKLSASATSAAEKRDARAVVAISEKNGWPVTDALRALAE